MIRFALPELAIIALIFTACCNPADNNRTAQDSQPTIGKEAVATTTTDGQIGNGNVTELTVDATTIPAEKGKLTVIDFNATWCRPCREFAPTFRKIARKYADKAKFVSVDVDANPQLAVDYGVRSIPQITLILPDGTVNNYVGLMSEPEFDALIRQALGL